ncbi:MAG: hypothetical protein DHS80DRAFT_30399 [Piptocephalis tieghemiana]|nr:MAG: hypothetical protein DHS80DRAFT_30399 [Piptocephalis tieghemiana]
MSKKSDDSELIDVSNVPSGDTGPIHVTTRPPPSQREGKAGHGTERKRKRRTEEEIKAEEGKEEEEEEEEQWTAPPETRQHTNPEHLMYKSTKTEVALKIQGFQRRKREEINESNRAEFLLPSTLEDQAPEGCARTNAKDLDRSIQIKTEVVQNDWGPLDQSVHALSKDGGTPDDVNERLENLEEHLALHYVTPTPPDVYMRLRALEAKILQLERDYPVWSATHFHQPGRPSPSRVTKVRWDAKGAMHMEHVKAPDEEDRGDDPPHPNQANVTGEDRQRKDVHEG